MQLNRNGPSVASSGQKVIAVLDGLAKNELVTTVNWRLSPELEKHREDGRSIQD